MEIVPPSRRLNPAIWKVICDTLLPYGVSRISVFGSYAKGQQKPESDLDLIITLNKVVGLFVLGRIREELIEKLGMPVDLLTERTVHPLIRDQILHEAMEIFPHEE